MDRLESEQTSFYRRVRDGYLAQAEQEPDVLGHVRAQGFHGDGQGDAPGAERKAERQGQQRQDRRDG